MMMIWFNFSSFYFRFVCFIEKFHVKNHRFEQQRAMMTDDDDYVYQQCIVCFVFVLIFIVLFQIFFSIRRCFRWNLLFLFGSNQSELIRSGLNKKIKHFERNLINFFLLNWFVLSFFFCFEFFFISIGLGDGWWLLVINGIIFLNQKSSNCFLFSEMISLFQWWYYHITKILYIMSLMEIRDDIITNDRQW